MQRPVILLALLAGLAALPATASAARPLELAVQDDAVMLWRSYGDTALAFDRTRDMGAERIRTSIPWASSMPPAQANARRRPAAIDWDFSALERLLAEATARGLKVQVTLTGPAPAWASGDRKVSNVRPQARPFAEFAGAIAYAFAGRIDRWSIWNEPNWHNRLAPAKAAPRIYRGLYRRSYSAIRAADPTAQVLIGELMPGANRTRSTRALRFVRAMTCTRSNWKAARRCAPLRADGFAFHPYNFARRPSRAIPRDRDVVEMGSLGRLTKALDRLSRRGALRTPSGRPMPLYLTEFGYFTAGPLRRSPRTHAAWMREAWRIAERNPRVKQLLQYGLIDPWPEHVTWRSAVLHRDGSPRPVYEALRRLATR